MKNWIEKCYWFFDFVCFNGGHFTLPDFAEKDNVQKKFFLTFSKFL